MNTNHSLHLHTQSLKSASYVPQQHSQANPVEQSLHLNPEKRDGFSNTHAISLFVRMQQVKNNPLILAHHEQYLNSKDINPLEKPGIARVPGKMIVWDGDSTLLAYKTFSDKQLPRKSSNVAHPQQLIDSIPGEEENSLALKKENLPFQNFLDRTKLDKDFLIKTNLSSSDLEGNRAASIQPKGYYAEYSAVLPRVNATNSSGKDVGDSCQHVENSEILEEKDFLKVLSKCFIGMLVILAFSILYLSVR